MRLAEVQALFWREVTAPGEGVPPDVFVGDAGLRAALQAGDEHLTAGQAVRIFGDADVIDIDALSLASAQERTETLERVAAWWNFAGRHVYARLQDDQAMDRPAHQQAAFT